MEKVLGKETIFRGRVLQLDLLQVETASGIRTRREVVRHGGAVAVLALTSQGRLLLVRQYRVAIGRYVTEIVAGILDRENESAEECARRELQEETGYQPRELVYLGKIYPSPGYITECIHLFAARLEPSARATNLDHDEELEVVEVGQEEFRQMLLRGEIEDGKTLAAWSLFRERGLDKQWLEGTGR